MNYKTYFLLTLIFLFISYNVSAQKDTLSITGRVTERIAEKPMENVTVQLLPVDATVITDKNGNFRFTNISPGLYELRITSTGFAPVVQQVRIPTSEIITISMDQRIIGLANVTVTATRPDKTGSTSRIDRTAIIHTQPTSLSDVMQLIPGQLAINPDVSEVQQLNLRQIPSTTDAAAVNAFGTQIMVDGVPVSNNANMQNNLTILNSSANASPPFSSYVGKGIDLRRFPVNNVENIEVLRGIASARYGDLSSGIVQVNSRIGAFKPELGIRLNPNLAELSVSAGIASKNNKDAYNITADYLTSREDVRDNFNQYGRLQGDLMWQRYWDAGKKMMTLNKMSFYKSVDNLKQDPDDEKYQRKRYANDYGFQFSTQGKWNARRNWLSNLNYIASLSYAKQNSFFQELVTRDLFPVSTALTDTTMRGVYGKSEYLNQTWVEGVPVNIYSRVEGDVIKTFAKMQHKLTAGVEYRMDVNKGDGRYFDILTPPRQNYSVGDRPRAYNAIPALHQMGYYLENKMNTTLAGKRLVFQAGVRADNVAPKGVFKSKYGMVVQPRLNLAFEPLKGFWLRGGYGGNAKAAPLNYLYPGIRYFDLVNFNYYAQKPDERLVILTTKTINLDGQLLKPYVTKKWDAGFDIEKKNFDVSTSFFLETTTNGIAMNREVKPFTYAKLKAESFPTGQPPVISPQPASIDTFFAAYDAPVNNRFIQNKGVEFTINIKEIKSIRTSINLMGAYINTHTYDDGFYTDAQRAYYESATPLVIPVYQSSVKVISDRFNTSTRFIHRIPNLNIVISALWQAIWVTKSNQQPLSPYAIGYVTRSGEKVTIAESERESETYRSLRREVYSTNRKTPPPLHLFNIRMTKEWKNGFGFSLFANNFLNYRPYYFDEVSKGYIRRNQPLFYGIEFNVKL